MARTATKKRASREGATAVSTTSTPRRQRQPSPQAERVNGYDEDDETSQLDTPTKKRPRAHHYSAARSTAQKDYDQIYEVPNDDGDDHRTNGHRSQANGDRSLEEALAQESVMEEPPVVVTPRKRGRPPKIRKAEDAADPGESTPTSKRRRTDVFSTPVKAINGLGDRPGGAAVDTPTRRTLADRSARRKSTRALIDRMVAGGDEDDEDEEALGDVILGEEEEEEEEEEDEEQDELGEQQREPEEKQPEPIAAAATELAPEEPPKRKRGRPPKVKKPEAAAAPADPNAPPKRRPGRPRKDATAVAAREPSPPRDLPAYEHYFFQNRPGAATKTSNNTLASLRLLTHDEYFRLRGGAESGVTTASNRHEKEIGYLEALHAQSFAQWAFELSQGFSVCLYGYGSKRRVLRAFAAALHKGIRAPQKRDAHKIVMVDAAAAAAGGGGGTATASASASTLRDILLTVAAAAAAAAAATSRDVAPKLPSGAAAAERALLQLLDDTTTIQGSPTITLVVEGIDAPGLRRPQAQATLARLAAHPRVRLLCAADTPGFPLLWDGAARSLQSFVFHDATTFRPLEHPEVDAVDEVHALLGRRVRRVGGKDGAAFVLRSLPENARALFQLLVGEVLAADEGGGAGRRAQNGFDEEDDDDYDGAAGGDGEAESVGLEYRMLYNKAVEEFICSSEMAFRTLLKEFHDHQMVTSRKDAFGTELLSLPFRRDELEALLEDLAS